MANGLQQTDSWQSSETSEALGSVTHNAEETDHLPTACEEDTTVVTIRYMSKISVFLHGLFISIFLQSLAAAYVVCLTQEERTRDRGARWQRHRRA